MFDRRTYRFKDEDSPHSCSNCVNNKGNLLCGDAEIKVHSNGVCKNHTTKPKDKSKPKAKEVKKDD